MQTLSNNSVAVIPFRKGDTFASVVTDGDQIRVYTNGWQRSFESMWWAVEALKVQGFSFAIDSMKPFASACFDVIAAPQGWETVHHGLHWYGCLGGYARVFGESLWQCQVECVRECLKYIN